MSEISNTLPQTAWATVIHMSYEGGGMKLRDLARSSSDPTSFIPALHIFLSRFWNRGAAARSRRSYESVSRSSSAPRFLTLVQQTAMVPLRIILRRPRRPGSPDTIPTRAHHEDRNFRPGTRH